MQSVARYSKHCDTNTVHAPVLCMLQYRAYTHDSVHAHCIMLQYCACYNTDAQSLHHTVVYNVSYNVMLQCHTHDSVHREYCMYAGTIPVFLPSPSLAGQTLSAGSGQRDYTSPHPHHTFLAGEGLA